jgi:AraC family transcriptional regulator
MHLGFIAVALASGGASIRAMTAEANVAFRIEVQGPDLPSHPGLYGAGEARCHSDPAARRLESCYAHPSIGVVVSGQFDYRSPIGAAEARPGVVLFGNAGQDFNYRYLDDAGVRRVVVALDMSLVAEASRRTAA